jgi:hypothetical protein
MCYRSVTFEAKRGSHSNNFILLDNWMKENVIIKKMT